MRKQYIVLMLVIIIPTVIYIIELMGYIEGLLSFTYSLSKMVLSLVCLVVLLPFRNKVLNIGAILVILSYLFDFAYDNVPFKYSRTLDNILYYIVLLGSLGFVLLMHGIIHTFQKYKKLNNDLVNLAYNDQLTGLHNLNYIKLSCNFKTLHCQDCLSCSIVDSYFINDRAAIMFVDIDEFKYINDYLGHSGGDQILITVAKRIKEYISIEDLVVRVSGDEFLIVLRNRTELNELESFASSILKKLNEPIYLFDKEISISVSIGISLYPEHGNQLEKLINNADIALTKAKQMGKNTFYVYTGFARESKFNKRYEMINDLNQAIKNNDFLLYFQPKADIKTNEITGLETLIRWNHPIYGIIYPDEFIPLAEEIGLIDKIDLIVLNLVAKQINRWIEEGKRVINISVNISPQFFTNNNFLKLIDNVIERYNIDFSYISFEITENIALSDVNRTKKTFEELKKRNIKIQIDDFGKGYSSLNYIKEFRFDYLKIDKSYIDNIHKNNKDRAIVNFIIELSKLYGFKVVSEGVEELEQLEILRNMCCDEYQGYLLSKPAPLEKLPI